MPCWEVRTIQIAFQAKHKDLLQKAIDRVGFDNRVRIEEDTLFFESGQIPDSQTPAAI